MSYLQEHLHIFSSFTVLLLNKVDKVRRITKYLTANKLLNKQYKYQRQMKTRQKNETLSETLSPTIKQIFDASVRQEKRAGLK